MGDAAPVRGLAHVLFCKVRVALVCRSDRIAVSRKRVSGLFAAAALSLAASQAQAVGFQRISLPMDMNGPALQGAAWCDAPEVEITVGRSVIAGTPDCPMPAGPMTLVVMSHGSGGSFLAITTRRGRWPRPASWWPR